MRLQSVLYEVELHLHVRVSGLAPKSCLFIYRKQCSSIMLKLLVQIQRSDCDDLLGTQQDAVT